jgi:hypothetical protein
MLYNWSTSEAALIFGVTVNAMLEGVFAPPAQAGQDWLVQTTACMQAMRPMLLNRPNRCPGKARHCSSWPQAEGA